MTPVTLFVKIDWCVVYAFSTGPCASHYLSLIPCPLKGFPDACLWLVIIFAWRRIILFKGKQPIFPSSSYWAWFEWNTIAIWVISWHNANHNLLWMKCLFHLFSGARRSFQPLASATPNGFEWKSCVSNSQVQRPPDNCVQETRWNIIFFVSILNAILKLHSYILLVWLK